MKNKNKKRTRASLFQSSEDGKQEIYFMWPNVTPAKKHCCSNHIRLTLKVARKPLHLLFDVAFQVNNNFCTENMHVLANIRPEICIKCQLNFSSKFVTFWNVTWRRGS